MDAAAYYAHLTAQYETYAEGAHAWHYGLWEPDVRTHVEALLRSNEALVRGLPLGHGSHVLDVGFGSGGFSVWLARQTGARVTGVTIVPAHVALAESLARESGVADRCHFLVASMNALEFGDDSFDLVVNQETSCYAADKGRYLASIYRVLRPGGWWRALDFAVADALPDADRRRYAQVCDGFHIPSLAPVATIARLLADAGFVDVDARDVTSLVLNTAAHIARQCWLPLAAYTLQLDRVVRPMSHEERAHRIGHVTAALHYSRGLQRGTFRYGSYSARKPDGGRR